jgi:MoxR-like ATPase
LERLAARAEKDQLDPTSRAYLRDQLGVLDSRCQWVADGQQRSHLEQQLRDLWGTIGRPQ